MVNASHSCVLLRGLRLSAAGCRQAEDAETKLASREFTVIRRLYALQLPCGWRFGHRATNSMRCQTRLMIGRFAISTLLLVICGNGLHAQQSPDDSLATLRPAEGIEVSVWACEPMVNNPTSMDIDSRGRVWIAEGLNYRMKQRQFETLKRVDKADRIKVLSDTDGNGKADSVTVFADEIFPVPLGLAVEEIWKNGKQTGTRVYVGNSPDLLVFEDTDGDDRADRRFALLTGFRGVDSDHGLHGMSFGPDGKLYFTVGDARYGADRVQSREKTFEVTDKSSRRLTCSNFGTTLRVNRDGTQLVLLSSGHRNNYDTAVDSFGNVFGSDNDDDGQRGARMYWVMDGGQYGYQHPDSSRHWAEELPGIIPKLVGTGNGAPGGLTVYEGDLLPKRYFGAVLQVDAGTHQVNAHRLHRHGAGFRSDYDVLLQGEDSWFRPVDLAVAPDGALLICDWYDAGVGGNRFSDQTTGRIYRLGTANRPEVAIRFDGTNPIAGLQSPNTATRLAARDQLVSLGTKARRGLLHLLENGRPLARARALHVLHDLPDTGVDDTIAALSDRDPRIRETALQLLGRDVARESVVEPPQAEAGPATPFLDQLLPLADDPDTGVRRALLMALRNVPTDAAGSALEKLSGSWDGRDRYYLEAVRAALINRSPKYLRRLLNRLADQGIDTGWNNQPVALPPYYPIGTNDAFLRPGDQLPASNAASRVIGLTWVLQRSESVPALGRLLARNSSSSVERAAITALSRLNHEAAGRLLIERYFATTVGDETKREIIRRLGTGISGPWNSLLKEPALNRVFDEALRNRAMQAVAIESIAHCNITGFSDRFMDLAQGESTDHEVRTAALTALGRLGHSPARKLTADLMNAVRGKRSGGPLALTALEANHALAEDNGARLLTTTIADSTMPLDVRRRSLQLATASFAGVEQILKGREQEALPADLESELSFLLHNHADRRVRRLAENALPVSDFAGKNRLHNASTVLAVQGNASRGRELFNNNVVACARCHRVTGEGPLVGPDLASIGMKYGDKELLYHIQFPSGAINYSFVSHNFILEDGQVLAGLVLERKDDKVTIGIATGQKVSFAASEIEEEIPSSLSLMPNGLVSSLTAQQVSDLIEYLLTLRKGDAGQSLERNQTSQKPAYPRVFRTFMPDSGPSAFAVELSSELALCYDPLRGGVNRVWQGSIDLSPTLQAKINQPARIVGQVFYHETLSHPLRFDGPTKAPQHRFRGYRYDKGGVVFEFTLGGRVVTESLRVSEDQKGLVREFALPAKSGPAFFTLEDQASADVAITGGATELKPGRWRFAEGARITMVITRKRRSAR